ncbi:MAG: Crp/Fnr family transcriptional regulator [Chthoniobacterales bacterium]
MKEKKMDMLLEEGIENETMETRVTLHPFFAGMKRAHLALLTDCAIPVHFKKGEVVFREGEIANRFYVLETGGVVLESSGKCMDPVILDEIGAGDLLGWSWMFPPYAWQFAARAVQETDAIFFYGTMLREHCERDPSLGYELMKRMSVVMNRRLQAAQNKMLSVNARQTTLLSLAPAFAGAEFDA